MADRPESPRSGKASRHGAASHIAGVTEAKKIPWVTIGIAAVLVATVVVFLFNDPNKDDRDFGKALESADARAVPTARGRRGALKLADSTPVRLGPETMMKVPPNFNTKVRGVSIEGTAHFSPAPGTGEKPLSFRVRSRKAGIESKGGVFVVSSFPEDKEVFVRAIENSLLIHPDADKAKTEELPVGPGMAISDSGTTRLLSQAESDAAFSWVDGNYTLTAAPLSSAIPVFTRWYNMDVRLGDKSLDARPVTAVMSLESSKTALEALGTSGNVHIEFRGDTLTLVDGAAPVAGKKKGK